MERKRDKRSFTSGFTLIEVMIVLAIIGLLFSFVGVNIYNRFKKAQTDAAKIQISQYQNALNAYFLDNNMYPHTSQGLEALIAAPTVGKSPKNWSGPYFGTATKSKLVNDPWNNAYRYECEDYRKYSIISDGPDGEAGTEDDIQSE